MKLDKLIEKLQAIQAQGKGDLPVYARYGASGSCCKVSSPHVTDRVDEYGPFDVNGEYVEVYIGD